MWVAGAYHPLTKNLNLVAEYTDGQKEVTGTHAGKQDYKTVALGAILFF